MKYYRACQLVMAAVLMTALSQAASAATVCVNPGGTGGCYASIAAAVAAASPQDTIKVAAGTYKEDVIIGKSLSLIGDSRNNTIIDAKGLANGIYIDGLDNPRLKSVVVTGFTIKNANFEGILLTNAEFVTVWGNNVISNDKSLQPSVPACPGIPSFETAEAFDCGEGIHLSGVTHSTLADNLVRENAGGILVSDDTGATHDNLITGNSTVDNPFDCGITLASHPPAEITGATAPFGVFHNTIAGNYSSRNGRAIEGAGAGVGIFTPIPGTKNYSNLVIGNTLTDNGLPGVAMHSHAPHQNISNNEIVANKISGNGADTEDAATPGPTGINVFGVSPASGTMISQNIINNEAVDIAVKTPAYVDVHLNNLLGKMIGVDNLGTGTVNATENWWGCARGPGAPGCSTVSGSDVIFTPWLTAPF